MKRANISLIFTLIFLGILSGTVISSPAAKAGILNDVKGFLEKLAPKIESPKSTPPGKNETETPPNPTLYSPTVDYEQAVIQAVEKASPSVVSIVISKDLPVIERCPYNPGLPPEFRDFFGPGFDITIPCEKGTKKQEVGGGSGFIISQDGMILTNKHVVGEAKADYTVLTNDGKKYSATVLARDPVQDLAVIKIDAPGLKAAELGDSRSLKLGQTAIAIGNALGEFRNTVSVGVISGLSRTITAGGPIGNETLRGLIQTDAAINPGNSGGPLLNLKGQVIGINTAIASGAQNIGFAIPVNEAKRDIQSVMKTGGIKVAYLGVRYVGIDEEIMKSQKLPVDYGALIRGGEDGPAIVPGSPAEKAGLQAEDIVLEVQGVKVNKDNPLSSLISKYNIGDTISLTVKRGSNTIDIRATLEERPQG
ncbi:MAG: trypsin-like peptidase domain-containing protein [Candidatus Colwellbacteria bacterium]|nr:trypsin-like peptidase domain-containing protein [Candidatus Colwellbacteria bacterium]